MLLLYLFRHLNLRLLRHLLPHRLRPRLQPRLLLRRRLLLLLLLPLLWNQRGLITQPSGVLVEPNVSLVSQ